MGEPRERAEARTVAAVRRALRSDRRCRTFLASYRPGGPRLTRPPRDLLAALRSLWRLGVRQRGRAAYWLSLWSTLLRRPRHISHAIELSIFGHHCRRVAAGLR
jgi:hypothetical protein